MTTFTAALNTRELVNGYDLSQYFNSVTIPKTNDTTETTCFQQTAKTRVGVLKDATWSASGYLDESTAGGAGTVLEAAFSDDATEISHYPNNDTAGNTGFGLVTVQTKKELHAAVAGVVEISAEAESNHAAELLTSLRAITTSTGGTSATVDNGAPTTSGYSAYLHLTSAGAAGTIQIHSSTNNVTFGTLATFTAHGVVPTSERLYAAGTAPRYLRVVHTTTGTATFQVGLSRNPVV